MRRAYRTKIHLILEIAAWLCLLAAYGIAIYGMNVLPDTIVTHFTLDGTVDGYGSPGTLLLMPIMMTLCVGGISLFAHLNPEETFNIPFQVRAANKVSVFRNLLTMIFAINLEIALFTLYLEVKCFQQDGTGILPLTILYVAAMIVTIVFFLLKAYKKNK